VFFEPFLGVVLFQLVEKRKILPGKTIKRRHGRLLQTIELAIVNSLLPVPAKHY
jgi:hypothetical protein